MNTSLTEDWFDDDLPKQRENRLEATLTDRMIQLRDGVAPPAKNEGQARQRRIEKLGQDLGRVQNFISDCDKLKDSVRDTDTVQDDAKRVILAHIDKIKRAAQAKARDIHDETLILRNS